MTYREATECINYIGKRGSVLGLGPITKLLKMLGDPQDKLKIIHVAGTNGKGSICTFLEMMYREEGKRVGRYISPTIHDYLERFQINGEEMLKDTFARLFTKVYEAVNNMDEEEQPTAFEIETAIAFLYFELENVDIVILEVGMGGREDATNVIKHPVCTVFANIGMDHMQFLGDTIEKIAYQKAGIIKKGCPVVCYPSDERVISVLREEYGKVNEKVLSAEKVLSETDREYGSDGPVLNLNGRDENKEESVRKNFNVADASELDVLSETLCGSTFIYKGEEYSISLAGTYQIYNAITAIRTKLLLDGSLKKEALTKVSWEGRFEKLSDKPLFIKDGAHNIQGAKALKESLQKHFTNAHFIFIIGVLRDKEYEKMMELLCPLAKSCYLLRPDNARGLETEILAKVVSRYCDDVTCCKDVQDAVSKAACRWREMTDADKSKNMEMKQDTVIVAWGSLSYIGEVDPKYCMQRLE